MAQHEEGVPLSVLSERHGIARPVLSRWWARYLADDLAGLEPLSRRPHHSPTQHGDRVIEAIDLARDFGWGVGRIADEIGVGHGTGQRAWGGGGGRVVGGIWEAVGAAQGTGKRGLARSGRNRLPRAPRRKARRYEKTRPGEL